jgi:predicted HD phosphohydrolase
MINDGPSMTRNPSQTADEALHAIGGLLERSENMPYIGEPVSQLEHALQAAELAERAGARMRTERP